MQEPAQCPRALTGTVEWDRYQRTTVPSLAQAVGSKTVREDGPEEREFADVVLPAKPLNLRARDLDSVELRSHRLHCSERRDSIPGPA